MSSTVLITHQPYNQHHLNTHPSHHLPHHQHAHNHYRHHHHHHKNHHHQHNHYYEHYHEDENDYYDHSSVVVVTALFDIGRGDWYKYTRSYEQYLVYMIKLLKLKNRMVIFTDAEGAKLVRQRRHLKNTEVFIQNF